MLDISQLAQYGAEVAIAIAAIVYLHRTHREILRSVLGQLKRHEDIMLKISENLAKLNVHAEFLEKKIERCCRDGSDR